MVGVLGDVLVVESRLKHHFMKILFYAERWLVFRKVVNSLFEFLLIFWRRKLGQQYLENQNDEKLGRVSLIKNEMVVLLILHSEHLCHIIERRWATRLLRLEIECLHRIKRVLLWFSKYTTKFRCQLSKSLVIVNEQWFWMRNFS